VTTLATIEHQHLLVKLDEGRRALAEARSIHEAKKIRDVAKVAADLMKQQQYSQEAINDAQELKLWAEWRLGEFLAQTVRHRGGHRNLDSHDGSQDLPEGITWNQSSRWQKASKIPEPEFREYIRRAREHSEPTTAGVLRLAKEQKREVVRVKNRALVEGVDSPDISVQGQQYATLVIDPPWDWSDEGDADQLGRARPTYATMTIEQVSDLPVPALCLPNCHLYLWITNRSLPKGFALLERWGFRYVTCLTWCKPSFGMGNYFRGSTEQVLFGVRGSLSLLRSDVGTWFEAQRPGRHSAKPEEFYKLVESCSPGPWLEMFARQPRQGWVSWGAESDGDGHNGGTLNRRPNAQQARQATNCTQAAPEATSAEITPLRPS
jgi:N6-adenosine-specific RNA methylase IME4